MGPASYFFEKEIPSAFAGISAGWVKFANVGGRHLAIRQIIG
jgi:hypothetical protein